MKRLASVLLVAAALALAACASKSPTAPVPAPASEPEPPPVKAQEATPLQRAQIRTELAAGYYERGQMSVALDELKLAERDDPTYSRIYNVYGLVYTMIGEADKAEANFRRALSIAPNDSELHHNWGAFLCSHGHPAESIAEFEIAARDPLYKTPEIALTNAGKCSVLLGKNAEGEQYFRRALSLKPQDASAAYNLALLDYREGRLDEAQTLMRTVMSQNNAPAPALYLGMCIEKRKGDRDSQDSYAQQIRNRFPRSPESQNLDGKDC